MTSSAKRFVLGVAAFALLLGSGTKPPAAADPDGRLDGEARGRALARARAVESDLVAVVDRVSEASVTILTRRRIGQGPEGASRVVAGAGSGVLVRYRGVHVVTNNHVVDHPGSLEIVTSGGRTYGAEVLQRDRMNDLALLTITNPDDKLHPVDLERDATSRLREGAWVVATGNPFLLAIDGEGVATLGVFSGVRSGHNPGRPRYLLQHDAEINPGNSGGPLWNLEGQLLGINGAIVTRSTNQGGGPSHTGTSITIPEIQVREFLDRALPKPATPPPPASTRSHPVSTGGTRRAGARLGLQVASSLDARDDSPDGVLVTGVLAGGLVASASGDAPQPGDRITKVTIDGRTTNVRSTTDLDSALGGKAGGTRFQLEYVRDRSNRTWSGTLGR